jgi:hypothetical protein
MPGVEADAESDRFTMQGVLVDSEFAGGSDFPALMGCRAWRMAVFSMS